MNKVTGKGLSTLDYDTSAQTDLENTRDTLQYVSGTKPIPTWSNQKSEGYNLGDVVEHNSKYYISKIDTNKPIAGEDPESQTTRWSEITRLTEALKRVVKQRIVLCLTVTL